MVGFFCRGLEDLSEQILRVSFGPSVNFINVKRTNFTYESLFSSYVLALNELSYKKRACKMLMKLTTGVNFINILLAPFRKKVLFEAFLLIQFDLDFLASLLFL